MQILRLADEPEHAEHVMLSPSRVGVFAMSGIARSPSLDYASLPARIVTMLGARLDSLPRAGSPT